MTMAELPRPHGPSERLLSRTVHPDRRAPKERARHARALFLNKSLRFINNKKALITIYRRFAEVLTVLVTLGTHLTALTSSLRR